MNEKSIPKIMLSRDLLKHLKRGNPWVFKDAIQTPLPKNTHNLAHLYSAKNEFIGVGIYHPEINLTFRLLHLNAKNFNPHELEKRFLQACSQRRHLLTSQHNSFRLINGEGDELPGLVMDYYNEVLVVKCDGRVPEKFWTEFNLVEIIQKSPFPIQVIYLKRQNKEDQKGEVLWQNGSSKIDLKSHQILENSMIFSLNIIDGAKTGFFLDQRNSRLLIKHFGNQRRVLNLFSYTGGFSIAAGLGNAAHVTSVDIAKAAIESSIEQWELNQLDPKKHSAIYADAFLWAKKSIDEKKEFDLIITDPPSFAPNEKSLESAKAAYIDIFLLSLKLLAPKGIMAFSSCSGHIDFEMMEEIIQESLSKARLRGRVIEVLGQPEDHPYPLALKEMRYLKFYLVQTF